MVRPGQLLAVMGPSGAGKSSLFNVITGRVRQTGGEVLLNGTALDPVTLTKATALVAQVRCRPLLPLCQNWWNAPIWMTCWECDQSCLACSNKTIEDDLDS